MYSADLREKNLLGFFLSNVFLVFGLSESIPKRLLLLIFPSYL